VRTPASVYKHPIQPMLVVFPIGLWILFPACDLIRMAALMLASIEVGPLARSQMLIACEGRE
jgi:uncharacterized membrane protein